MTDAPLSHTIWRFVFDALPTASLILLALIGTAPLSARFWPEVGPLLTLLAVYFWASDETRFLPWWVIFSVGVLLDVLTGLPLGYNTLILLLVAGVAQTQKRAFANRPFYIRWFGLAVISFGGLSIMYVMTVAYYVRFFDPTPVLGQWIACVLLYPLVASVLGVIRVRLSAEAERHA